MNLRIPGPIPVPREILEVMSRPMMNHRGPEFKEILHRATDRLKEVFDTTEDMFVLTSSGTGAMEAAIVNTLSPGDKVLCASIGSFGKRFGEIASIFGADVSMLDFPPGSAADPTEIRDCLEQNPDIKAVLVTHNETSTGVTNDLGSIAQTVKGEFNKLLLVDGISSVGSIPLHTDGWQCDVVTSASQKGWMLPPGLGFISFSKQAWEAHEVASMPKLYFELSEYKRYYEMGQPPYTPAISVIYALDVVLKKLLDEGMEKVFERHAEIAHITREGVKKLGLSLLAEEKVASNTITSVKVPSDIDGEQLLTILRDESGVILAGGQESLKGKILRIGHMGYTTESDIQHALNAISDALPKARIASR